MPDGLEVALHHRYTEQQKAFVAGIVSGLKPPDAALAAGYPESSAKSMASVMMQQPHINAAIQIYAARELSLGAPGAIKLLRRFVEEDAWDARIRLAAAKTILDRAGYVPPKAVDATRGAEKPLNDMSTNELRALADKLEGEIAGRAKPVSSANAAPKDTQAIDDII